MIIEMRTYKLKPGKRARFLEIFHSMPMIDKYEVVLVDDPLNLVHW